MRWSKLQRNPNYSISDTGLVRRDTPARGAKVGRVLKLKKHPAGYRMVTLCQNNVYRQVLVHVLVAETFHGPRPARNYVVNHKNEDKQDNRVENLEWVTASQNILCRSNPRVARGSAAGNSKLTEAAVVQMRERAAKGERIAAIAREFGVSAVNAGRAISGKTWKHVPGAVENDAPTIRPPKIGREQWCPAVDYPGQFVSSHGRVRGLSGMVLKPQPTSDGYWHVRLCHSSGMFKTTRVHLLVMRTFVGPRPSKNYVVNHRNGVKTDNRLCNLEYATYVTNNRHGLQFRNTARGAQKSKLTDNDVRIMRRRYAAGETSGQIAKDYPVSAHQVLHIVTRKSWAHVA